MMNAKQSSGAESRWRTLISAQEASGESIAAYAERHGIKASTLYWWRSHLRRADRPSPRFLPIEIVDAARGSVRDSSAHFEIEFAGGRRLRVPPHFDADELACLIAVLERAC